MAVILQQIPSYGVGPANTFANVKSKIDHSDPNPAHKLKHTVEDLTIDSKQGREINPRFSGVKYSRPRPSFRRGQTVDYSEFPRRSGPPEHYIQRAASVDTPTGPSKVCSSSVPRRGRAVSPPKMSGISRRPISQDIFEEAEEDELQSGARVAHEQLGRKPKIDPTAFTETADMEEKTDTDIYGMDVTNTNTETTVVLKHLLATASKPSDMAIIEEDEESFYESEDTPLSPSHASFSLPNPIPRLIVTGSKGELVETVVDQTRFYTPNPSTGASSGTQSRSSFMSTKLPLAEVEEEEEEEESQLSTRL